ncbi:MAG TPA: hypothetical protein VMD09_14610 [Solirubrobacteraceae bacterium]|nr:hypothetical protein [Solirubrobacteraceae bacterium]
MIRSWRAIAVAGAVAVAVPAATAGADSFTPVRLQITVTPVARLHAPLSLTVHVSADPSVLDDRDGPMRMHVVLAGECGGTFAYTQGVVLVNKVLNPQPTTGRAYSAVVRGSGRPNAYGVQTVCAYLDDNYETFATDTSNQVNVSQACTTAASRYDKVRRKRGHKRAKAAAKRAARRACGPGVPL